MKRIRACCLFLMLLLITSSCEKQSFPDPGLGTGEYSEPVLLPVVAVNGPYHAYPYEEISLSVTYMVPANYSYVSFPGGGTFTCPGINYEIGIYGSQLASGGSSESYYATDTYYFSATETGWYYLNFVQPGGGYIQHIVSVY